MSSSMCQAPRCRIPTPDPDTPAPPRFLPEFDNALLSHADRTRVISKEHRRRLLTEELAMRCVLLDGFARAMWRPERSRGRTALVIPPFEPLPERDRDALADEGARLLHFMAPDADTHDVRFVQD